VSDIRLLLPTLDQPRTGSMATAPQLAWRCVHYLKLKVPGRPLQQQQGLLHPASSSSADEAPGSWRQAHVGCSPVSHVTRGAREPPEGPSGEILTYDLAPFAPQGGSFRREVLPRQPPAPPEMVTGAVVKTKSEARGSAGLAEHVPGCPALLGYSRSPPRLPRSPPLPSPGLLESCIEATGVEKLS